MENEDKMTGRKTKDTNDMYNSPFATRLRSLIEDNNLTQAAVAQEMNTTRQTIGNWMLGKSQPDFDTLDKLAYYFNTSTDYLLGRTNAKTIKTDVRAICDYLGIEEESLENLRVINVIKTGSVKQLKLVRCTLEVMNLYGSFYKESINELLKSEQFNRIIVYCTLEKIISFLLDKVISLDIDEISKMESKLFKEWEKIEAALREYNDLHDMNVYNIQKYAVQFGSELTDIDALDSDEINDKLNKLFVQIKMRKKAENPYGDD